MWKYFSRGVRETFERGRSLGRTDVRVNKEAPNNAKPSHIRFSPCIFKKLDICFSDKAINARIEEEPKERKKYRAIPDPLDSWLGAFSCSSALVIGWVLTQPYYHWRKWWSVKKEVPLLWDLKKESLVQLLANVAVSQPISHQLAGPSASPQPISNTVKEGLSFGPKTAEQAFDEAAENFLAVHNSVMGDVENRRGIDCISRKKNSEAVGFFRKASSRGHPPAAYNLAQCYELGIGTKQDFKEAAKWYEVAAGRGHPTAMYNLGVFHAHGWGGLVQDPAMAKKLFIAAAEKGQPDAKAALGLQSKKAKQPSSPPPQTLGHNDVWVGCVDNRVDVNQDPNHLYNLAVTYEDSIEQDSSDPQVILDLYKLASDLGHPGAKSRLQILQAYDAIGLLSEFLSAKKGASLHRPRSLAAPSPVLT